MNAAKQDIVVSKGADFSFTLRIIDEFDNAAVLTGGSTAFKAQIREDHGKPLVAAFTITAIGDGQLRFVLTNEQTKSLDINKKYKWDFFWTDSSGIVSKLIYGNVIVDSNVTNI